MACPLRRGPRHDETNLPRRRLLPRPCPDVLRSLCGSQRQHDHARRASASAVWAVLCRRSPRRSRWCRATCGHPVNDVFAIYVQGQASSTVPPAPGRQPRRLRVPHADVRDHARRHLPVRCGPSLDFVWGCTSATRPPAPATAPTPAATSASPSSWMTHRPPSLRLRRLLRRPPTWFGRDASIALLLGSATRSTEWTVGPKPCRLARNDRRHVPRPRERLGTCRLPGRETT